MEVTIHSHRESDNHYDSVIYQKGKYRVIVCKNKLQWIIQQRSGKTLAGARWRAISHLTRKDALIRVSRAYFGSPTPIELLNLPNKISEAQK